MIVIIFNMGFQSTLFLNIVLGKGKRDPEKLQARELSADYPVVSFQIVHLIWIIDFISFSPFLLPNIFQIRQCSK